MKLRNFLLTVAIFLSAGIAFAQTTTSSKYFTINDIPATDADREGVTDYTWTVPANNNRTSFNAFVVQYGKGDFSYDVFGTSAENEGWSEKLSVSYTYDSKTHSYVVDIKNSSNFVSYTDVTVYDEATGKDKFLQRIYHFSVPYEVKVMSEIGVLTSGIFSNANQLDPFYFYKVSDQQYFLSFGGATTVDGKIIANKDPQIAFGQPLPAPVTTLLIALGFGAAFVMYRNRKSVKA